MKLAPWLLLFSLSACDGGRDYPRGGHVGVTSSPGPRCEAQCSRISRCLVELCDEDTASRRFDPLLDDLEASCLSGCDEVETARLEAERPEAVACFARSSCRAVLGFDVCHTQATYSCEGPSNSMVRPPVPSPGPSYFAALDLDGATCGLAGDQYLRCVGGDECIDEAGSICQDTAFYTATAFFSGVWCGYDVSGEPQSCRAGDTCTSITSRRCRPA